MKTRKFALLTLIALTIAVISCSDKHSKTDRGGKTYHVSMTGNDKNPGTQKKPLQTISAAALLAMPGDTVLVHEGIYREQVNPPRGGLSDDKRITYMAVPGHEVVITGSEVITGWKKLENDTWTVSIPNSFFGDFNPYNDLIRGDWFIDKGRSHHTGAVYLNGHWLNEAATKEEVLAPVGEAPLWFAEVDDDNTNLCAQFIEADPNAGQVEINVRQAVFYPEKTRINYITVTGFTMRNAATNWAPPTAEQVGLVGTNWSKGWIIENNNISYSKCTGITLGKYGDEFDNTSENQAEGYVLTIERALQNGWHKDSIGSHVVHNNRISHCEQAGIVGSMGCAFSTITGNIIHDIHVIELFMGHEMAGIKFHGPVDTEISHNIIYNTVLGIWLDWMVQGSIVHNNLLFENKKEDLFYEVTHGPLLTYNNICLSSISFLDLSRGNVFAHNLFAGRFAVIDYDSRLTPYLKQHSTEIAGMNDNPSGDHQFYNNLFVGGASVKEYGDAILPVVFNGNVYTKGASLATVTNKKTVWGEMTAEARERLQKYTRQGADEQNAIVVPEFDAAVSLLQNGDTVYLELALDKNWLETKRKLITTGILSNAMVTGMPFVYPDGSEVIIDTDYFGNKRSLDNPSPGPFEINQSGKQTFRIWPLSN
jgi:alpha-N-arabinofuranosidase